MKEAQFFEPSSLCLDSERQLLFVADTNNNAVRSIDLAAAVVSTLLIETPVVCKPSTITDYFNVKVGSTCSLTAIVNIPESLELSQESIWEITIPTESSNCLSAPKLKGSLSPGSRNQLILSYSPAGLAVSAEALVHLSMQYCEGSVCRVALRTYDISLQLDNSCTEIERTLYICVDKLT